ncbi:MAG: hypothetical protein JWP30_3 [Homoserinimonas sp.]|nr:hypothetical protein [Homoserinimonas sp.]
MAETGLLRVTSSYPGHGTAAVSLLAEVAAAPRNRLLAGISGYAGSGKSALLDDLEAQYNAVGIPVRRGHADLGRYAIAERGAVLIDDAHELSDSVLTRIHSLIEDRNVNVVVAYGFWPQPPALSRLASTLERHHPPVVLGLLSLEEIADQVAIAFGTAAPVSLTQQVAELTGGVPWLVHLVVASLHHESGRTIAQPPMSRCVMDQLGYELKTVGNDLHQLLLALTVGFDLADELPPALGLRRDGIDNLVAQARSAGLLLPDGRVIPLVRRALLETTPAYRVRTLQRELVEGFVSEGRSLDGVAEALAVGGLKDQRIARTLEQKGDNLLSKQPAVAAVFYDKARAAGSGELATAARRAQAASAVGDLDGAAQIVDGLLAREDPPDLARAVDVAAAVWAQRGMLGRSAEIYRWLGVARIGHSAVLAAVAMIGTGDREGAEGMLKAAPASGSPTLVSVAATLMGQGLQDSLDDSASHALTHLVRASDMMTAAAVTSPLPEFPAALAATVALHSGDLESADSIICDALAGGQCGAAARPRLLLLHAWVAMREDRLEQSRSTINEATASGSDLVPRDALLLCALEVALARRADDGPALVRAWQRARRRILHVSVDLYSLLPLGELLIAATRLREVSQLEPHLADAWKLLKRLGDPPLWSVPLHWAAVQAAILAERPGDLAPHAAALVRASEKSHLASVLAAAGRVWVSVLAGDVQVAAVEDAARALARVGMSWEGSRLAGHAAARTRERVDMTRLLACARSLHPRAGTTMSAEVTQEATSKIAPSPPSEESGLSPREREVAQLVLNGKTYGEIGEAIFISPRTVEHHVARIRRHLGVATRSELLAKLHTLGSPDKQDGSDDFGSPIGP